MAAEANKTLIGAFVVGAAGLAVAAVILFGSGNLYRDAQAYVLFFSGSVKGLSIGAPVQMKGVQVGTVSSIQLLFDREDVTLFNRVDIKITPDSILMVEAFEDCTDGK
ncbi:MAG: MlaD family protein, partial [Desulfosarcina sp.]